MKAPFDLSKLRKKVADSIKGMSYGFNDPTTFLDTGCFALNYLMASRFDGGVPLEGKTTMFAGDSGSGKSYIVSANLIKSAQEKDVYTFLIDTENALDKDWLERLGVNVDPSYMEKYVASTVDDTAKFIGEIIELWDANNKELPYAEQQKMLIVVDSVGMLITPNQERQFMEGDQKGDLGLKAKQVSNMMRVIQAKIASKPIGVVFTNHVYASQDQYTPDVIPGGKMLEFATSVIVQMNKLLLKKNAMGDSIVEEGSAAAGIRSSCVVRKSRYAKPFEKVQVYIPYDTGMNRYSGMFDLAEKKGLLTKSGNWYSYTSFETGEVIKATKRALETSDDHTMFDCIIREQQHWEDGGTVSGFNTMNEVGDILDDKGNVL
jgi:RecA/RadA recombinase